MAAKPKAKAPPSAPDLTDSANGARFARQHRHHARYCHSFDRWMIYDGKSWVKDTRKNTRTIRLAQQTARSWVDDTDSYLQSAEFETIQKNLAKFARSSQSKTSLDHMLSLATSEPGMTIDQEVLDADPWLFNCQSGVIDLRNGELRPHSPADFMTRISPVQYDPHVKAKSELWDKFLEQITGGERSEMTEQQRSDAKELHRFIRRAAGYMLTGLTTEKCFFLAHSEKPDTGKSTFLDALKAAMGTYAETVMASTWLKQPANNGGQPRADLAKLRGVRAVIASEFEPSAHFDEGTLKCITGGDDLPVRDLYEPPYTFKPKFKIVLASNFSPRFTSSDEAMVRRAMRIPFSHEIKVKDKTMRDKLMQPEVSAAVLQWMVAGCLDWQKNGLEVPDVVRASNKEYRAENSPVRLFIEDCLDRHDSTEGGYTTLSDMRVAYNQWSKDEGNRSKLGDIALTRALISEGFKQDRTGKIRFWEAVTVRQKNQTSFGGYGQGYGSKYKSN